MKIGKFNLYNELGEIGSCSFVPLFLFDVDYNLLLQNCPFYWKQLFLLIQQNYTILKLQKWKLVWRIVCKAISCALFIGRDGAGNNNYNCAFSTNNIFVINGRMNSFLSIVILNWYFSFRSRDASDTMNHKMGNDQYCLRWAIWKVPRNLLKYHDFRWNSYETNLLSTFEGLLDSEALSDVTLFCEGLFNFILYDQH